MKRKLKNEPQKEDLRILKTLIAFSDAKKGNILKCDTIYLDNKYWLVPEWIENDATGKMRPLRIICLDYLPHQELRGGSGFPADFVLNQPIPKCVFAGEIPKETSLRFYIVESPDILFDIPKKSRRH